jgi:hypothetical protein
MDGACVHKVKIDVLKMTDCALRKSGEKASVPSEALIGVPAEST